MKKILPILLAAVLSGCGTDTVRKAVEAPLSAHILAQAEAGLSVEPVTVTASSCERSAGGLHDFYSEGDYWWPDPKNPDGPYIRRDGESNPDNFSEHRHAMVAFSSLVGNLCSAWILTGDGRYAAAAEKHLRAWFMDPATMMNPSLEYAQAIKGIATGRGIGIIDTIHLIEVAQSVLRFSEKGAISEECTAGCKAWFAQYLEWLTTHPYGIKEMNAKNNHGTWWFVQAASFASLTGNAGILEKCREAYKNRFLPDTMDPDGSFPQELARTKPYNYSIFQLDAMTVLCQILSTPEDDLWTYSTPDGRNIRKALDFMVPYLADKDSWPYPHDVSHWDEWPVAVPSCIFGWARFRDRSYYKAWEPFEHFPAGDEMRRNIALRNPLIWL